MIPHPVQFAIGAVFAATLAACLWFGRFPDEFRSFTTRRDSPIEFWAIMALFAVNVLAFGAYGVGMMDR